MVRYTGAIHKRAMSSHLHKTTATVTIKIKVNTKTTQNKAPVSFKIQHKAKPRLVYDAHDELVLNTA